jgi:hypothetical protein
LQVPKANNTQNYDKKSNIGVKITKNDVHHKELRPAGKPGMCIPTIGLTTYFFVIF